MLKRRVENGHPINWHNIKKKKKLIDNVMCDEIYPLELDSVFAKKEQKRSNAPDNEETNGSTYTSSKQRRRMNRFIGNICLYVNVSSDCFIIKQYISIDTSVMYDYK